jgi:hypothetical protein
MKLSLLAALAVAIFSLAVFAPNKSYACACGCDVFDVGTSSLFPSGHGGTSTFAEYDFMDQVHNWSGTKGSPSVNNDDKEIRSNFFLVGFEHMFHCGFGLMVEAPLTQRFFKTTDDNTGLIDNINHTAFGDVRIMGNYTGFSKDMSSGVLFGVKLPTGDWRFAGLDRDTSIGSGSTDLLLGAYHHGPVGSTDNFSYFVQALLQAPMAYQGGYRPGTDVNAAVGVSYGGFGGPTDKVKVSPVLQLIASTRTKDAGPNADPPDSGYERLLLSPGVQVDLGVVRLYGDVELPVYQRVNGNQLVAPALYKFIVSKSF